MGTTHSWHLRRRKQIPLRRNQDRTVTLHTLRLNALPGLANRQTANSLQTDLNEADDKKRTLNSIDSISVNQIFSYFGLKDPGCDADNNGVVEKDELKCLNKIWKYYVPKWS